MLVTSRSTFLTPATNLEIKNWRLSEDDPNVQNDLRIYARTRLSLGDTNNNGWFATIGGDESLATILVNEIANKAQGR